MLRVASATLVLTLWGTLAHAQSAPTLTLGASHWHGDFGSHIDTDISAAIVNASAQAGGATFKVTAPWMRIEGPSAAFVGLGATPLFVSPNPGPSKRREGWGDATFSAAVPMTVAPAGLDLQLLGSVKAPTASKSSGLSTGKADYSVGVAASAAMGRIIPTLNLSYRFFGDTGAWALRSGPAASLGVAIPLPSRATALVSYDYARGASQFISDSSELVFGLSSPVSASSRLRLTGFVAKGLSDGAADISGGVALGLPL